MATGQEYTDLIAQAGVINRAVQEEESSGTATPVASVSTAEPVTETPEETTPEYDTEARIAEIEQEKQQAEEGARLAQQAFASVGQQQQEQQALLTAKESNIKRDEQIKLAQYAEKIITRNEYQIQQAENLVNSGLVENPAQVQADIEKAKQDLNQYKANISAITDPKLMPYINFTDDGSYSIDVQGALKAGVPKQTLYDAGVSIPSVVKAKTQIKQGKPSSYMTPEQIEIQNKSAVAIPTLEFNRFKSLNVQLPDGNWISRKAYNKLKKESPELFNILVDKERGLVAVNQLIKTQEQQRLSYQDALKKAIPFMTDIPVNSEQFIYGIAKREGITPFEASLRFRSFKGDEYLRKYPNDFQTLLDLGYTQKDIERFVRQNKLYTLMSVEAGEKAQASRQAIFKEFENSLLQENPSDVLSYINGAGVASWNIAINAGGLSVKELYNTLNDENKRTVLAYYAQREGKAPSFEEQIAASPIPAIESAFFLPLGKYMAMQEVTPTDWGLGIAQVALIGAPVIGKGTQLLISRALPLAGVSGVSANLAGTIARSIVQPLMTTAATSYFMADHITRVIPDESIPTWQKVVLLGLDATFLAISAKMWYDAYGVLPSSTRQSIKNTLVKFVKEERGSFILSPNNGVVEQLSQRYNLNASQIAELRKTFENISKSVANRNQIALYDNGRSLERIAGQLGDDTLINYARSITNNPRSYLEGAANLVKGMSKEQIANRIVKATDTIDDVKKYATKTLTAEDVGLSKAEFTQFLKQRTVNPKLTVEQFKTQLIKEWQESAQNMLDGLNAKLKGKAETDINKLIESMAEYTRISQINEMALRQAATMLAVEQAILNLGIDDIDYSYLEKRIEDVNAAIADDLEQQFEKLGDLKESVWESLHNIEESAKSLPKSETQSIIKTITDIKVKLDPMVKSVERTEAKLSEITKISPLVKADAKTKTSIKQETITRAKTDVKTDTKVREKEDTKTNIVPALDTSLKYVVSADAIPSPYSDSITKLDIKQPISGQYTTTSDEPVKLDKFTEFEIKEPKKIKTPAPPIILSDKEYTDKKSLPSGSITWKQGYDWKYIPPPYNQLKPISLGKEPPAGSKISGRTPLETIQIIGQAKGVPQKIAVDLGFVDILILNGMDIEFAGGGLETNVGTGISSKTRGMTKNGTLAKAKRKKTNWRDELVSLKGFRP